MKKKSQAYYFLVIFSVFFVIALSFFIKYRNGLTLNIVFGIGSLVMLVCFMVSIVHFVMHFQGISVKFSDRVSLLAEEKGKKIFALFGYLSSADQLTEISGNNITDFQPDSKTMMYNLTGEEQDYGFDIVETCGLFPSRKFKLQLDSNLKYKMVFNPSDLSKLQSPGFCILVNANANTLKMKEKIEKLQDFYIRFPKVENGSLYIHYGYKKFAETLDDARLILSKRLGYQSESDLSQCKSVTLYDLLLHNVFLTCPGDEKDICPMGNGNSLTIGDQSKFWINQPNGKMALFLLSNFSLYNIAGRGEVWLSNSQNLDDLNKKIRCIQGYIARHGKSQDSSPLSELFNRLRRIISYNQEKITYCSLHKNYLLSKGRYLSEAISEDLKDNTERYIYALASYQDCTSAAQSCDFIKNLLRSNGCEDLISQAESLLGGELYEEIKHDAPCYESMRIFSVGRRLFSGVRDTRLWYTGRELIDAAREYILKKYIPDQLGLIDEKFSSMMIGPVDKIVFLNEKEKVKVASSISVGEVVNNSVVPTVKHST